MDALFPVSPTLLTTLLDKALYLAYRASAYLAVHVLDDAAMMAVIFC